MTNPASIAENVAASFTAPAGATLEAGNTYFVVAHNDRDLSVGPDWRGTNSDDEDATSITGWTIANNGLRRAPADTSWIGRTYAFNLRVNGTAVGGGTPSTDATLSALTVTAGGTDLVTFASGTTDYTASVANDVAEVTVTATKNDSGATIEYLDASDMTLTDAGTGDAGHQVALAVGETVIKVKVTAEDGNATQTYMVTVTRAAAMTPTCTLNTGDLWCGVVTVGAIELLGSTIAYGFTASVGALSDTGFPVGTNNYTIDAVAVSTGAVGSSETLPFSLTSALTAADEAKLVLHVGSASFAFSAASGPKFFT